MMSPFPLVETRLKSRLMGGVIKPVHAIQRSETVVFGTTAGGDILGAGKILLECVAHGPFEKGWRYCRYCTGQLINSAFIQ